MAAPLPPPGWYPDPSGAPGQRYFDGHDWSVRHPGGAPVIINNVVGAATPVVVRSGPNHVLHLILTVLTFGLWLPVWLLVTLASSRPGTQTWRVIGVVFAALMLVGLAGSSPGAFVVLALLAGGGYLAYRLREHDAKWRLEQARIAARADAQNQALLFGHPSGTYGQYPPNPLP
ncbi:DUF2510 domain-containing protein [Mycobacterium sp. 1274756.6]|uniref:DUF2510 domain-containing protein n=1 Tax=Mycobacterium sp. 1274756.6 TaxID=1834076 RepID=UPI000801BB85|nr:DUF2510 domain-containing protein [Mycobacterium sp. 1274756.6]OBJ70726.1 hypothetical protein A5643_10145 [Mycobacterium sp. 1274756.6]